MSADPASDPSPLNQIPADLVERIQHEWARAYPDLDVSVVGVLGRVQRLAAVTSHRLDRKLDRHGVTRSEFDVLGALARADGPIRASEVVSTTLLSGASITKLTEGLARRDLLARRRSERDGRVVLLELTDAGRALVDAVLPRRLADDEQVLAALKPAERDDLSALLQRVLTSLGE